MTDISVGLARRSHQSEVLAFVRDEWRHDHVFVSHPDVFEWQHTADDPDLLTIIEGRTLTGIGAVLGFIPQWRFDPALRAEHEIFLALWKLGDRHGVPGLGLRLMSFVLHTLRPRFVGAVGLASTVVPLYRAMRFELGMCDHFVMPNRCRVRYQILAGADETLWVPGRGRADGQLRLLDEATLGSREVELAPLFAGVAPRKSVQFLLERYCRHPYYRYRVYLMSLGERAAALVVCRVVAAGDASALRIVDFIGDADAMAGCGPAIQDEIKSLDCEYVDILCAGLEREALQAAGFNDRRQFDGLIVPNHFEPFVQRNIEISYAYRLERGRTERVRLFRGDGDQDRPNLLAV